MIVEGEVKIEAQEVAPHYSAMLEAPEPDEQENQEGTEQEQNEEIGENTPEELAAAAADGEKQEKKIEENIKEAEEAGAAASEIQELRSMLRSMKQENLRMKIQLEKVLAVQEGEMGKEVKPGVLEALQGELNELAKTRSESFTTLLEAMELNPKFEDVRSVCSAGNFNDIFDSVASIRADENGTTHDEELLKVKLEVWAKPNPYKYMYEVIKEHHPSYKGKVKEAEKKEEEKKPAPKTAKEILEQAKGRTKEPVKAPGSIASLAGGAAEQGGWTAAKIDAMSESELGKVPRDVYSKWLTGELD